MNTKSEAVGAGAKLADEIGEGWQYNVWENLGWHYNAINGPWQIHQWIHDGKSSYTAFLNMPGKIGGIWAEHGATPQEAMVNTLKVASTELIKKNYIVFLGQETLERTIKSD